jgi:hypothetical protein
VKLRKMTKTVTLNLKVLTLNDLIFEKKKIILMMFHLKSNICLEERQNFLGIKENFSSDIVKDSIFKLS